MGIGTSDGEYYENEAAWAAARYFPRPGLGSDLPGETNFRAPNTPEIKQLPQEPNIIKA